MTVVLMTAVAGCGWGGADASSITGSGVAAPTAASSVPTAASSVPTAASSVPTVEPSGGDGVPAGHGLSPRPASGRAGVSSPAAPHASTPLQQWLAAPVIDIAHHGGSADWPSASPKAYQLASDWNPALALEFSARRTADGVWVGSEDPTTGAVYGTDLTIATATWDQLSALRSLKGGQPMSRLDTDLLDQVPADRVLFVDDKDDSHVDELLDLLDRHGGAGRTVIKSYWQNKTAPTEAHRRGYLTWGYYYAADMGQFAATQSRFDLLGIDFDASAATYAQMLATGKRVIAHIVDNKAQADQALARGATGLMVSGVKEVVPQS